MADIINIDPHAGNQDPQPYDGGDIQVLTPVQEANKINEKIIQYVRHWYNDYDGYIYWWHRGRLWKAFIGFDVATYDVTYHRGGVTIRWDGEDHHGIGTWHYPAE